MNLRIRRDITIKQIYGGILDSNSYVVYNDKGKSAMIVDCGCKPQQAMEFVTKNGYKVLYIVLTHGHFDHAHYIDEYAKAFPDAKIVCHVDELKVLYDPDANLSTFISSGRSYDHPYLTVRDGDTLTLDAAKKEDEISFKIIHAPGHTPGSMCLLCEESSLMLTGDVLFANGYGRTDFKYGSFSDMRRSLTKILALDGEITFYSGHGDSSKIKYER